MPTGAGACPVMPQGGARPVQEAAAQLRHGGSEAGAAQHFGGVARLLIVNVETQRCVSRTGWAADVPLTALFREHHLALVRVATLIVGDVAAAEDVVQDVFERLHRRQARSASAEQGLAYVRAAVLNGCRSVLRRRKVARGHAPALAEAGADTGRIADAAGDRDELAAALRSLPRRQREVLVLRYYCDLDHAEIAAALGMSASTARATSTRGLAALRAILTEGDHG